MASSSYADSQIEDDYPYCPNWKEAHYNMARLGPRYYPIDVFRKFDSHRKPLDKLIIGTGLGAFTGLGLACVNQWAAGKPVFSQFHRHILGAATLFIGSYAIIMHMNRTAAREQSRLMHYVESRPEYFPVIERYKYKDTLGHYRMKRLYRG